MMISCLIPHDPFCRGFGIDNNSPIPHNRQNRERGFASKKRLTKDPYHYIYRQYGERFRAIIFLSVIPHAISTGPALNLVCVRKSCCIVSPPVVM